MIFHGKPFGCKIFVGKCHWVEQFFSPNVEFVIKLVVVLSAGKEALDFGKLLLQVWQNFFVVVGFGQLFGLVDAVSGDVSAQKGRRCGPPIEARWKG